MHCVYYHIFKKQHYMPSQMLHYMKKFNIFIWCSEFTRNRKFHAMFFYETLFENLYSFIDLCKEEEILDFLLVTTNLHEFSFLIQFFLVIMSIQLIWCHIVVQKKYMFLIQWDIIDLSSFVLFFIMSFFIENNIHMTSSII